MKKSFISLGKESCKGALKYEDISFEFSTQPLGRDLIKCSGKIFGSTLHNCDRCGEEFLLNLDEEVEVLVSDGFAKPSEELENIIEFFDGNADFDEVFISELEAIKSDYFYCENCNKG